MSVSKHLTLKTTTDCPVQMDISIYTGPMSLKDLDVFVNAVNSGKGESTLHFCPGMNQEVSITVKDGLINFSQYGSGGDSPVSSSISFSTEHCLLGVADDSEEEEKE